MMKYLVVTTKNWNILEYEKYSKEFQGDWHLITDKKDLNLNNINKINPEYIFFPHWSWLVPEEVTNNYKCICFHMSDLPYGRGGSPLQNLIARGHKETKISALRMTKELDAGDIYVKADLDLSGSAQEIFVRASKKITKLIHLIITKKLKPKKQEGKVVLFDRRNPTQSRIPDNVNLDEIYDHIRMLDADTYPRAYIDYKGFRLFFSEAEMKDGELRVKVKMRKRDE